MKLTTEELITVAVGWLFCPIERVYEILNFLTGDNLFTHQLPRAFRACEPHLNKQYPWLAEINRDLPTPERFELVRKLASAHPGPHELQSISATWLSLDPLQELAQMVDPSKIIVCSPTK